MNKEEKIKVLKQEIRGIKRTMARHKPNRLGLRRFKKHLKIREERLVKLAN